MIRLTQRRNGAFFYVQPEAIYAAGHFMTDGQIRDEDGVLVNGKVPAYYVTYEGDGGDGVEVQEAPEDVSRLKAAWELRFKARELRGTLPMAVHMDKDADGNPCIQFMCCAITKKLLDERRAARPAWKRVLGW